MAPSSENPALIVTLSTENPLTFIWSKKHGPLQEIKELFYIYWVQAESEKDYRLGIVVCKAEIGLQIRMLSR